MQTGLSPTKHLKKWLKATHIVWKIKLTTQVQARLVCNWRLSWLVWIHCSWNSQIKYWNSGLVMCLSCHLLLIPTRTLSQGGDVVHIPTHLVLILADLVLIPTIMLLQESAFAALVHIPTILVLIPTDLIPIPTGVLSQPGFWVLSQPEAHPEAIQGYPGTILFCVCGPSGNWCD